MTSQRTVVQKLLARTGAFIARLLLRNESTVNESQRTRRAEVFIKIALRTLRSLR